MRRVKITTRGLIEEINNEYRYIVISSEEPHKIHDADYYISMKLKFMEKIIRKYKLSIKNKTKVVLCLVVRKEDAKDFYSDVVEEIGKLKRHGKIWAINYSHQAYTKLFPNEKLRLYDLNFYDADKLLVDSSKRIFDKFYFTQITEYLRFTGVEADMFSIE